MNYLQEFDKIFNEYKNYNFAVNHKQDLEQIYNYVYYSNRLEGNRLNLAQTTALFENNIVIGSNIPFKDYLEHKGLFKAVQFIISSAQNNYPLNDRIIKKANELTLSNLWNDDANYYGQQKKAGQTLGEYKVLPNKIVWNLDKKQGEIKPISEPGTAEKNCINLLEKYNNSNAHIIEKIAYLTENIYLNQFFVDGNKRTARLITTFETMKYGLPFTAFDNQGKNTNFNHVLVTSYLNNDKSIIEKFIANVFMTEMSRKMQQENKLNKSKPKNMGFMI